MAIDGIHKLNNYNVYPTDKVGAQGGKGVNPFGESYKPEAQKTAFGGSEKLDSKMLAAKKESFENGLGGTNDRGDHKLFEVA